MSILHRRFYTGLLAAVLPLFAAGAAERPNSGAAARTLVLISLPYERFVLANGLTVLVHTDHSVPTVFVGLWYGVGAKDEPAGRTGFAHLFEHLMFQQTGRRPGDLLTAMSALGSRDVNAMTTGDATLFHETVPTGALDRALWLEADRMANLGAAITQSGLDRQRDVVKNEKRQGEMRPGAYARARLLATLYPPGHPYAHDPIGSMADLDRATLAEVKAWFADYYGARNAVLVLSGDIDAATARRKVAEYFAAVPAGPVRAAAAPSMPPLPAIRRETVRDAVPNASLTRTWFVPSDAAHDLALLELVAATLTSGRDAPLRTALTGPGGPALGVSANVGEQRLVSTLSISVALRPGASPDRVSRLLDAILTRYVAHGPDPRALPAILLPAEAQLLRSLDGASAVGRQLGGDLAAHGDPVHVLQQRRWYADASPSSLRAVAARWLTRPYHQLLTLPGAAPVVQEPDRPTSVMAADPRVAAPVTPVTPVAPSTMPSIAPPDGRVVFPPVTVQTLANGLRLVVAERPRLPFVQFAMRFPVGSADEPAGQSGLVDQAFGLLTAGTTTLDEAALERSAGGLGLDFTTQVGERSSSFGWSDPSATLDRSFALAAQVLHHPAYPSASIDRLAADAGAQFDAREQVPQDAAPALLRRALWGEDHPLGRIPRRGEPAGPGRAALIAFHDRAMAPAGATLYAIGDVTPQRVRALAERYLATPVGPDAGTVRPLPPATGATPRIILVDAPGAEQSMVALGALVRPFAAAEAPAERLADAALAGALSGRLNTELREKRGWSYGFSGTIDDVPTGPRLFSAAGSVAADHTAESVAIIARTLADFAGPHPLTPEELEAHRESAIREIPAALTTASDVLGSIIASDSFGLPAAYAQGAAGRLAGVTLTQARQAATALYRPGAMDWVIVGDLRRIEPAIRALHIAPVEIWDVYGRRLR